MSPEKAVEILEKGEENKIAAIKIGVRSLSIKALKKQIPQKPKNVGCDGYGNNFFGECPSCGLEVNDRSNYCPKCGQAINWEARYG